jgi:hypothetical protein
VTVAGRDVTISNRQGAFRKRANLLDTNLPPAVADGAQRSTRTADGPGALSTDR